LEKLPFEVFLLSRKSLKLSHSSFQPRYFGLKSLPLVILSSPLQVERLKESMDCAFFL